MVIGSAHGMTIKVLFVRVDARLIAALDRLVGGRRKRAELVRRMLAKAVRRMRKKR